MLHSAVAVVGGHVRCTSTAQRRMIRAIVTPLLDDEERERERERDEMQDTYTYQ